MSNELYATKSIQRAATNLWIHQQHNNNPAALKFISLIKKNAKRHQVHIQSIKINLTSLIITATTSKKINARYFQRALSTTLLFDRIKMSKKINNKNRVQFTLKTKISKMLKRNSYSKAKQKISPSQTQVRYLINSLISKIKTKGQLALFCPSTPLPLTPKRVGTKVKLVIYSYKIKFTSDYTGITQALKLFENNRQYISIHNLTLMYKKSKYLLNADLRFYQIAIRRNNRDKNYAFERVVSDKICVNLTH